MSAKNKALSAKAKSSASNNDSTHDTINVSKSSNAPVLPLKVNGSLCFSSIIPKDWLFIHFEPVIATDKPKSKTQKKRKNDATEPEKSDNVLVQDQTDAIKPQVDATNKPKSKTQKKRKNDATEPEKSDNVLVQDQTDVVKPQVDATNKPKSKTQKKRKITDASPVSDQPCKNLLENAHTSESPVDTDAKTKVDTVKYPLMTLSDSTLVSESSLECKHQNASTNEFNFIKGSTIATSNKENSKKSSVSKKTKESKTSSTGASKLSKTTLAKNDTTSAKKSTASLPTTCLAPITSTNKWENATLCGDAARKEVG
ncbi:hypothetical protein BDEG_22448 [Batrachochytrium dendrobatidis JEL423]|uniref:Uncharacterized protein n=1 Tax=Batrachochytrium dendrobatidis (strain JEL423) TaxID=403673 RepID=A0A177WEJ4_BATDL|nr:hypothetical protein BDEG_22448 [Batrachochytrium dendrobatidis JEL423]